MPLFRTLSSVLLFLLCATSGHADLNKVGDHNVGAAAGFVTGYGLSYRQWIRDWGFQLTTAPFHQESENSSSTQISLGITALRKIKEAKLLNLFAYLGPHYHFYRYTDTYLTYTPYGPPEKHTNISTNRVLFVGGGPGIDFHFLRISFSMMFGIAGHHDFDTNESGMHLTGETALFYSF
ncbi:MAG: hypothetical protein JW863_00815 [Chitinispirillaceae bacterium]|nr:hypothetical protein [Chitinispirillaceae bacterium]